MNGQWPQMALAVVWAGTWCAVMLTATGVVAMWPVLLLALTLNRDLLVLASQIIVLAGCGLFWGYVAGQQVPGRAVVTASLTGVLWAIPFFMFNYFVTWYGEYEPEFDFWWCSMHAVPTMGACSIGGWFSYIQDVRFPREEC